MSTPDGAIHVASASDYSTAETRTALACPHDLVWFEPAALDTDRPDWVDDVLAVGRPAVVRRAPRDGLSWPVGLRGATKSQRWASRLPIAAVTRRLSPEDIDTGHLETSASRARRAVVPAFDGLAELAVRLCDTGLVWGVTGALGYELATGTPVAHDASDIDIVVCMPHRDESRLAELAAAAVACRHRHSVRCDIQLETPRGGVALADWQSGAGQVMVKSDTGPYLTPDPWQPA